MLALRIRVVIVLRVHMSMIVETMSMQLLRTYANNNKPTHHTYNLPWLPKLHKIPYGARSILTLNNIALAFIKEQGVKCFWIVDNSQQVCVA